LSTAAPTTTSEYELPPISAACRSAKGKAAWRRRLTVLLFMSPWIVGFTVFFGYPLVDNAYLSFTHYDLLSNPVWIGLANYKYLFGGDAEVWPAVSNTLWFLAIAVPLQVLFAFGIAVMVTRAKAGVGIFRTIFYLPTLAPSVAATLGFVFLFNPGTGPVNTLLRKIGITGPLWFQSPHWAKPSLTLLSLWGIGNAMVIFLAARRPKANTRGRRAGRCRGVAADVARDPADDQPGDPVLDRDRCDPGPSVLRPGVRG
jgi:multiple sugar transport system permease protein